MLPRAPENRAQLAVLILALLPMLMAVAGLAAHYRPPKRGWVIGISAFAPYLMLGAPLAAVLLIVGRQWIASTVALAVVGACMATQAPLFTAAPAPVDAHPFVVLTANLRLGQADAAAVVDAVRRHQVDALMLQELTPQAQQRLEAAGLDGLLPHHLSEPRAFAYGTGLWSRYPLADESLRHDFTCSFASTTVTVPGVARPVRLAALHVAGPWPKSVHWLYDMHRMPKALAELKASGQTVVVGGDFNATPDVAQFRNLLKVGYRDVAEQAGAGLTRTYPSDKWYPPLIAIDHVLVRHAVGRSARTIEIPGSDHRALLVTVALPA